MTLVIMLRIGLKKKDKILKGKLVKKLLWIIQVGDDGGSFWKATVRSREKWSDFR